MRYERRYVQFNNLVFDTSDVIEENPAETAFKYSSHELTFGNGSYAPFKRNYLFAQEANVSLAVRMYLLKLPCEHRPFYRRFVVGELNKPGKLWAVQNNELIWAYAACTNVGAGEITGSDLLSFSLDFTLPEGVWHKADQQRTFIKPYDPCLFMECFDYKDLDLCRNSQPGECCYNCFTEKNADCNCCWCNDLCKDYALCLNKDKLQSVYSECGEMFQIDYNCGKGQEYFGDDYLGQKFCNGGCDSTIAGLFYADTDIPTTSVDLIIHGGAVNPMVTINDNSLIIKGDYTEDLKDPILTLKANGDVFVRDGDCCEDTSVPVEQIEIPSGSEFQFTVNPGNNRLVVDLGVCCGTTCVYVQVDGLTI